MADGWVRTKSLQTPFFLFHKSLKQQVIFFVHRMLSEVNKFTRQDMMTSLDNAIVRRFYPFGGYVPLSAILYTPEQAILARHQQSLAVVRTFQLGSVFVTMTIFRNENFLFEHSVHSGHPVMIGPTLVHTADDLVSYDTFFSHLNDAIFDTSIDLTSMYLTSDFERVSESRSNRSRAVTSLRTFCGERLHMSKDAGASRYVRDVLASKLEPITSIGMLNVVEAFEKLALCQHLQMKNALYDHGDLRLASHMADDVRNKFGWECCVFNREPACDVLQYIATHVPRRT